MKSQQSGQVSFVDFINGSGIFNHSSFSFLFHIFTSACEINFPMCSKRVILRLLERDFPDMKYPEIVACVKAIMIFNERPAEEALQEKHFWHFQPSNGRAGTRFHIVIDIDKFGHSGAIERDFPHEIYRVVKIHDEM